MIITAIMAAVAIGFTAPADTLNCPVMGSPANPKMALEYAGMRVEFCCKGCDTTFAKEPGKFMTASAKKDGAAGDFLFDPVTGKRIDTKEAKFKAVHKGVRYSFESEANLAAFNADPAKFTTAPEKDSLTCAVTGETVSAYSEAAGYVDFNGTRYYVCCAGCLPALAKDTKTIVAAGKAKAGAPKAVAAKDGQPMASTGGACCGEDAAKKATNGGGVKPAPTPKPDCCNGGACCSPTSACCG